MKFGVVFWGEQDRITDLHPELAKTRPDLAKLPFPQNPVPIPSGFPYLFYVLDRGRVVGFRKAIPDNVYMCAQQRRLAWAFDSFIDAQYRGQGVGRRLVELQTEEMRKRGIISAAAFSAPAMMRIYKRQGYHLPGFAPRVCLVRRANPFLSARLSRGLALTIGSLLANAVLAVERALRHILAPAGSFDVERIDEQEFAALFDRSVVQVAENYWAGKANWIVSRLLPQDSLYQVRRANETEPCALLVVRNRPLPQDPNSARTSEGQRVTLMEFARLDDKADVPQLIAASLERLLLDCQVDAADVITSWQALLGALTARGFRRRGTGMSFAYKLPSETEPISDIDLANWHLTHFCSDGFMFE